MVFENWKFQVYCIRISIDNYKWTVEHRYSDFVKFDAKRFEDRKKSFLPPKKLVGNMVSNFKTKLIHHYSLKTYFL